MDPDGRSNESTKRKNELQDGDGKMLAKRIKSEKIEGQMKANTQIQNNPSPTSTMASRYYDVVAVPCAPYPFEFSTLANNNSHPNHDHGHHHRRHQQGRLESKEIFAIHQQPHQQMRCGLQLEPPPPLPSPPFPEQDEFFVRNRWIATTLVTTYLIEVTVQVNKEFILNTKS